MKETSKAPQDLKEHFLAFTSAINWKEPFIRCLIAFHIIIFIIMIVTRKNIDIQFIIFMVLCFSVYMSERINTWSHMHWQTFSTQDYFDKQGVFSGMMFSGPMLIILFIQLLSFLSLASSSLIQVKRMELKHKKSQQATTTTKTDVNDNSDNSNANINDNDNGTKDVLLNSNDGEKSAKRRTGKGKK